MWPPVEFRDYSSYIHVGSCLLFEVRLNALLNWHNQNNGTTDLVCCHRRTCLDISGFFGLSQLTTLALIILYSPYSKEDYVIEIPWSYISNPMFSFCITQYFITSFCWTSLVAINSPISRSKDGLVLKIQRYRHTESIPMHTTMTIYIYNYCSVYFFSAVALSQGPRNDSTVLNAGLWPHVE